MKAVLPQASGRRLCRVLKVSRSRSRMALKCRIKPQNCNMELESPLRELIQVHPTFGYRWLWAIEGCYVGRNTTYRLLQKNGWLVTTRSKTAKPRVKSSSSQAANSNYRWAMDMTHIPCGSDGWGHLVAIIDCHDREIVGYEFSRRGRAKEAERALENACLYRFGTLRPQHPMPTIRSGPLVTMTGCLRNTLRLIRLSKTV